MKRAIPAAAAALAFALVAAACGSDNKSSSGGTSATTAAATTAAATTASTAAATTATSAAAGTSTSAAAGGGAAAGTFAVPDANCPADAKAALPAGAEIKIGQTMPLSGPLAAFGAIPQGVKVYFDKVNAEEGGVDGHKLTVIAKDDQYDPTKTVPAVTELIQSDKVLADAFQIGTPNVGATRALHEQTCTPQLIGGSGFPAWGDPKNHPWTVGGILAYNTEAKIWSEFIAKQKPGATVGLLIYNNDFGKSYQTAFTKAAADKGLKIVATQLHEGTATNIDNEVTALLAANPDFVIGGTTAAFCPKLMAGLTQGGYQGKTIISSTCQTIATFWKPVDPAGNGMYVVGQAKDPSDPTFANDPAVVQYKADVAKYGSGLDANNGNISTGYNAGSTVVQVLKNAAKLPGGLNRVNVMNAAWNLDTKAAPLALGGKAKLNGNNDAYIVEYAAMLQYDASKGVQVPTGDTFDLEGKTGLFTG
jgi:ABC-type branched-subunit amino acid transport system substrate-binding protein